MHKLLHWKKENSQNNQERNKQNRPKVLNYWQHLMLERLYNMATRHRKKLSMLLQHYAYGVSISAE